MTNVNEAQTDAGIQSVVALFSGHTRIRFVTDFMIGDHQIEPTRRRLSFIYTPETPAEIIGEDVEYLSAIDTLIVNYKDVFQLEKFDTSGSNTQFHCDVVVNGVVVGIINSVPAPAGTLNQGQAKLDVAELFKRAPAVYAAAVLRQPAPRKAIIESQH